MEEEYLFFLLYKKKKIKLIYDTKIIGYRFFFPIVASKLHLDPMVDWLLPKPSRFFSLILQQLLLDLKFHPFESKAQISPFKILTDSKIRFFLKNSTFDWIRDLHLIFLTQEHLLHQRKQCLEHKILPFQKESLNF